MGLGKLSSIETGKYTLTMKDSFCLCAALKFPATSLVGENRVFAYSLATRLIEHLDQKGGEDERRLLRNGL